MWWRRWGLPGLLAAAFVAVAAVDVVRGVLAPPPQAAPLLSGQDVLFEPERWVIDLREPEADPESRSPLVPYVLREGWGETAPGGRWTSGPRAEVGLPLATAARRTLIVQARPDRRRGGPPGLQVVWNGVALPVQPLEWGLHVYRLSIPRDIVREGLNILGLRLVASESSADDVSDDDRMIVRHLMVTGDAEADFRDLLRAPRPPVERDRERVVLRSPGRLVVPFEVQDAGSFLLFDYRFQRAVHGAACELVVARRFPDLGAVDVIRREHLAADDGREGRVRAFLGHHTGSTVLWIETDAAAAAAGLEVRSLRLVADSV